MRSRLPWILLLMVCLPTMNGCVWPFRRAAPTTAPVVFEALPTAQQIVQAINHNSSKVYQLQSQVKVSGDGIPGLTGDLALEKPHRFRLQASLLGVGGNGVDMGSNDELFWVWMKSSMPGVEEALLYARHHEFASSPMRQMFPIEPAWIRDGLGLPELDPAAPHQGPFTRPDGTYEIRTPWHTPAGELVRITVVDSSYGWILEQMLIGPSGQPLVIAKSSRHRHYPEVDVSLPHRVQLSVAPGTQQALELTLDVPSYRINQLSGDPYQLWSMPRTHGVPVYDLASPDLDLAMLGGSGSPDAVPPGLAAGPSGHSAHLGRRRFRPEYRGRLLR